MTYNISARQRERGVALLITMLSVMLLSVIVLGMMVSTNTETTITSNFRDKQNATFSAMAGLQEARDRIQPATANIVVPVDSPQLGAQNIIYIINPKSGETVEPWNFLNPNNPYKDTELCQEGVLGLAGTPGVPCTTIASGGLWYLPKDNSLSTSAPWNLTTPLDVKWIRISLKTNNMTPIAVNGNAASGVVVCWDGSHQITVPAGYGPDCKPDGSVATILLKNPGTGYLVNPTVTISAPPAGGIQAVATAVTALTPSGIVQSATLTAGGSGYTSAPTVTLTGDGTGATATATFLSAIGAPVASVNLASPGGQCYSSPPGVAFSGGGGSGAAATAVLDSTPSCIQGWNVIGSCFDRKGTTVSGVGVTGGGGSGFSGTITFKPGTGAVVSVSLQNPGTGYTSLPLTSPVVFSSGLDCPGLTISANLGYLVQSVSVTNGGSNYTSPPTVTLASGAGSAATPASATATLGVPPPGAGQVTGVNIVSGGSGYTSAPLVTFTGGGGGGAAATTTLGTTFTITGFNISNPGKGYLDDPTVTLSPPTVAGGIQAVAKATLGRGPNYGRIFNLTSLAVTKNGSRTMMQMEATTPVSGFPALGALTIDGHADPSIQFPNSNPFVIHGSDANSCGETPEPDHPAIAAYDPVPSPTNVSSVDTIIDALPRPDHYTGTGGTPSVVDVFGGMGETLGTPTGLWGYIQQAKSQADSTYTSNPSLTTFNYGSATDPVLNYVDGNLTVNGTHTGYGTLVVTGKLTFGGNFNWYGPVLVVGDGVVEFTGGGNGKIIGTMLAAKIWDNYTDKNLLEANGSPSFTWNGGGGNGILYDHCWATNLLDDINYNPPPTTQPLKVLSLRTLAY